MTEGCKCFTSTYEFCVYKKQSKWWKLLVTSDWPIETKIITVHGNNIKELEQQRDELKEEIQEKWGDEYMVSVFIR